MIVGTHLSQLQHSPLANPHKIFETLFFFWSTIPQEMTRGCLISQGSYRSWKTWKVMEFHNFIFQAWKVMEFRCGVMESLGKSVCFL